MNNDHMVKAYVNGSLYLALKQMSHETGRSLSDLIRWILLNAIEEFCAQSKQDDRSKVGQKVKFTGEE